MTTIKLAVLRHTRAKDGSYKIRISIGHKSETHYIVTKYKVTGLANFVNGMVVGQPDAKAINLKLRQLLTDYDERLERIPNAGDMTCEELRNLLRDMPSTSDSYTLRQIAEIYCRKLKEEKRDTTAQLIMRHIERFLKFTHGDIRLQNITPRIIDDYVHHLRVSEVSNAYINISIAPIKTLTNYAVKMQYVRYDIHPLTYFKKLESLPRDLALPVEDMRKLFDYQPPRMQTRRYLDFFKLSYMLGGMNLIDLLQYDFRQNKISYIRTKTKRKNLRSTDFNIPPEARSIIEKYMNDKTGRINDSVKCRYSSYIVMINRSLQKIAKRLQLEHHQISFYSARKSFVQHGFDLGIPLEILEYCVGQTMKTNRPIFNYAKVMSKHADDAIRKILDNIKEHTAVLTDDGMQT